MPAIRRTAATLIPWLALLGCAGLDPAMDAALREAGGNVFSNALSETNVDPAFAPVFNVAFDQALGALLSADDQRAVAQESAQALESAPPGRTVTWGNPSSGATAQITPGETRTEQREVVIVREKTVSAPPPLELLGQPYRAVRSANLRAAPSTGSARIGGLAGGEPFTAVGRTEGAPWLLVGRGNRSVGYVHETLVAPDASDGAAPTRLRRPVNLDEVELSGDVVADKTTAKTKCRGLKVVVDDGKGKQASDQKTACKSGDGSWEL